MSINRQQVTKQDRVVAVMGPTGTGKSTFIEYATRQNGQTIGHGLQSCTEDIRIVRVNHPHDGRPVALVDTPGFDDTYKSDNEILTMIANWLVKTYRGDVNLATIVYLHRISDNRMAGSTLKNLQMFAALCGRKAMPNVIIATTMWKKVTEEEGERAEQMLKRDFWKNMLADGCRTERFKDSHDSAWQIIDDAKKDQAPVLLPREIVDSHLRLNETQVGIVLNKELEKLIKDRKDAARRLREQVQNQNNELVVQELNELQEKINQTADQLRELKIPFTRRVRLFFKGRG
ncbi:hypothetical protein PILCRDRAFT_827098 [Piloderma croceum F 1598]|uniref:G domain-containing protein n=1 Tax=Piloderma croceum (strain F 1598) TaxID=765440 RepID=A0A0C3ESI4_PILCF|nr:hypothetical protein PILCRDRAFT_830499 [Piloderma croceum F 1598]KIM75540.1 hypothetical protein PILCRDRAFT_827098 [Piloderma croceum F 1598]